MLEMLEHRLTKLEQRQETHEDSLDKVEKKLEDIVKMLSARPTWLVAGFVTVLTSVTAGLIVYVATTHH